MDLRPSCNRSQIVYYYLRHSRCKYLLSTLNQFITQFATVFVTGLPVANNLQLYFVTYFVTKHAMEMRWIFPVSILRPD